MSLLLAALTATVLAIFGVPYRHFQCWFSWARLRAVVFVAAYFALAGAGGGFLGWGVAQVTDTHTPGNLAAQGFLFGVAGSLALRADFRSSKPRPATPKSADVGNAASVLGASLRWITQALDDVSGRQADAILAAMEDGDLLREVYHVHSLINSTPREQMSDAAKKKELALLDQTMKKLDSPDEGDRDEGRESLISYCVEYYIENHRPRRARARPPKKNRDINRPTGSRQESPPSAEPVRETQVE